MKSLVILLTIGLNGACANTSRPASEVSESKQAQKSELLWFQDHPNAAANWSASGISFGDSLDFRSWALSDSKMSPAFNSGLSLNCWEYILYNAYRQHQIDRPWLKSFYEAKAKGEPLESLLLKAKKGPIHYYIEDGLVQTQITQAPLEGDLIFMDGASHVVMATGWLVSGKVQVVSFSPLPIWGDGQITRGVAGVRPEVTTLEAIIQNLHDLYQSTPSDWNNIKLELGTPVWGE